MIIRKLKIEDYDKLYQLWKSIPGMGINNIDDSIESITKYLLRNPTTNFVAEDENGEIIGAILSGHDGRRGHISHTAVKPIKRRKGIATALLKFALSALAEQGIAKVTLTNFTKNDLANSFWEAQGFIKDENITYRTKIINENLVYEKNIYMEK